MLASRTGWMRGAAIALGLATPALSSLPLHAEGATPSSRVALVIGEGGYRSGALPAAPDDAGLVAQVLAGGGFDVTGARDLDGDALRRAIRDFLDRAAAAGPDGIAVVYLAGRAVQADGDDYFVPVDARLARPSDVPIEALRLADMTHALAALPIQARVVVVDGAYAGRSGDAGSSAPGLAVLEAEQGELLAFNAAPGTLAPTTSGPFGVYAQALVAAMKQGGVPVAEVFARVRLAVNRTSGGAVVPWHSDRLTRSFSFFDRAPGAPAVASAQVPFAALEKRPLRDFPPDQAYDVALARDTLPAYAEYLTAFPSDPLARRVRLLQAGLREALFWRAAVNGNTSGAFWTYLARYPKGPHVADARRRLTRLAAGALPPPRFVPLGFDVPPPEPDEGLIGPVVFDAPDLPPPPSPPVFLLPPPIEVAPVRTAPPPGPLFLPVPVPVAIPYVRAPAEPGLIAPPRGIAGDYPHPRPYARGPNGDGLVVQAAPPSSEARPRPRPAANAPLPNSPEQHRTPPGPVPQPASQPRPPTSIQPKPPAVPPAILPAPPTPPTPAAPTAPAPPAVPVARPLPTPGLPVPPTPPRAPTPPPGRSAPVPPSVQAPSPVPAQPSQPPRDRPAPAGAAPRPAPAPAPTSTTLPVAPPPRKALPSSPLPAVAAPLPHPDLTPKVPPAASAPRTAAPDRPSMPAPHPAAPAAPPPSPPRPAAPERPVPDRPAPKPEAAHPAGDHHPACGRPGEPPCRP